MRYRVKCDVKQMFILLPEGVVKQKGDVVSCPKNCLNKNGSCKNRTEFKCIYAKEAQPNDKGVAYDESEAARYFSVRSSQSAATPQSASEPSASATARVPKPQISPSSAQTSSAQKTPTAPKGSTAQSTAAPQTARAAVNANQTASKASAAQSTSAARSANSHQDQTAAQSASAPNAPAAKTMSATASKWASRYGAATPTPSSANATAAAAAKPSEPAEEYVTSTLTKRFVRIHGNIFSDDNSCLRANPEARVIKEAIGHIFRHWDIDFAFNQTRTALSPEFEWLLALTMPRQIKCSEVKAILTKKEYGDAQKFFYLYYDVIFKREKPKGFYFYNGRRSAASLSPIFSGEDGFVENYCASGNEGKSFRAYYGEHRSEILHYLDDITDDELMAKVTFSMLESGGVYLINKAGNNEPVYLCSLGVFRDTLPHLFNCSLAMMENMTDFLRKYRVSATDVLLRQEPLEFVETKGLAVNDEVYKALGISTELKATQFRLYLTLLNEYVSVFRPTEIALTSTMLLRKNFFFRDVKDVVGRYCAYRLGTLHHTDVRVAQTIGNAFLLKTLIECGVLNSYVESCENRGELSRVLSQITDNPSIAECLRIYGKDMKFFLDDKMTNLSEYLKKLINTTPDPYTFTAALTSDKRTAQYLEIFGGAVDNAALERTLNEHNALFERNWRKK